VNSASFNNMEVFSILTAILQVVLG